MKRLFIILAMAAMIPATGCANDMSGAKKTPSAKETATSAARKTSGSEIVSIISDFSGADGMDIVQVNGLGTAIVRKIAGAALDSNNPEEKAILDMIRSVRKVTIVEYDGCEDAIKSKFNQKLGRVLTEDSLLADVKSDGDQVRIYGVVSDDGGELKNFVMHVPSESVLICLFGTISTQAITRLIEAE